MSNVHELINIERKRKHLHHVYWSREMAKLAKSQANYCAKEGHLVHSKRFAFKGGENLAEGGNRFPPKAIVNCWMSSNQGHREYLLSPRVTKAGVGISKRHGKTFVAWAFSDKTPSYPDCPGLKPKGKQIRFIKHSKNVSLKFLNMLEDKTVKLIKNIICFLAIIFGIHLLFIHFNMSYAGFFERNLLIHSPISTIIFVNNFISWCFAHWNYGLYFIIIGFLLWKTKVLTRIIQFALKHKLLSASAIIVILIFTLKFHTTNNTLVYAFILGILLFFIVLFVFTGSINILVGKILKSIWRK